MKLIIHIFLKDVRHLWREITVSLALPIAYGHSLPDSWLHPGPRGYSAIAGGFGFLNLESWARILVILVPLAWLFTVVRAIQSESLVGDRQFWITRPCDWRQLLSAKVLFILVFVNLPMLILDLFLLARTGFVPGHYLAGLFWMQLLITLILLIRLPHWLQLQLPSSSCCSPCSLSFFTCWPQASRYNACRLPISPRMIPFRPFS
jgi:hypothetical protein